MTNCNDLMSTSNCVSCNEEVRIISNMHINARYTRLRNFLSPFSSTLHYLILITATM